MHYLGLTLPSLAENLALDEALLLGAEETPGQEGLRVWEWPGLACAGVSDLAVDGRKVSGNAQQRKREHFLHHGTLLYGFDATTMARYLRLPPRQPDYRQRRQHAEFVTNLPRERGDLEARLR